MGKVGLRAWTRSVQGAVATWSVIGMIFLMIVDALIYVRLCAKFSADLATEHVDETYARHSEPEHIQTRHC